MGTLYFFKPDKTVEVHDAWPYEYGGLKKFPPSTIVYEPGDTSALQWCVITIQGNALKRVDSRMVPKWCKAYALLIN